MAASDIEWTEATWNPIAGCAVLSPGCTNCYAMRMAARLQAMGMAKYAGTTRRSGKRHVWTGRVNVDTGALTAPLAWKKPQRIFVNSMSDLFQDKADEAFIRQVGAGVLAFVPGAHQASRTYDLDARCQVCLARGENECRCRLASGAGDGEIVGGAIARRLPAAGRRVFLKGGKKRSSRAAYSRIARGTTSIAAQA